MTMTPVPLLDRPDPRALYRPDPRALDRPDPRALDRPADAVSGGPGAARVTFADIVVLRRSQVFDLASLAHAVRHCLTGTGLHAESAALDRIVEVLEAGLVDASP